MTLMMTYLGLFFIVVGVASIIKSKFYDIIPNLMMVAVGLLCFFKIYA